jgi:intein/homing endonuclease
MKSDGTIYQIGQVTIGDEITGEKFPGMIDERQPDWVTWTTEDISEGIIENDPVYTLKHFSVVNYITINNALTATPDHNLFVNVQNKGVWGWVKVGSIEVGDILLSYDQTEIPVTSITSITDGDVLEVVLLDLDKFHTYFAGCGTDSSGNQIFILSHNLKFV